MVLNPSEENARRVGGKAYLPNGIIGQLVRPGLVGLGAILLALAAVTVGALVWGTSGPPISAETSPGVPEPILANATSDVVLSGSNSSDGVVNLVWSSTIPLNVVLYNPVQCVLSNQTCVDKTLVVSWSAKLSGHFREMGALREPFFLVLNNTGSQRGTYTWTWGTGTVTMLPEVTLILVVALALVVGVSGGMAMFLGLFLRAGVYDGPQPIVSHSADDVDDIVRGESDSVDDFDAP